MYTSTAIVPGAEISKCHHTCPQGCSGHSRLERIMKRKFRRGCKNRYPNVSYRCPQYASMSIAVAFSILTNPIRSNCTTFPASSATIGSQYPMRSPSGL